MPGRGGRNRGKDPHRYWNIIASTKPEAQVLASRLGLDFPTSPDGIQSSLKYPIRRLTITGEDTAANFKTLLGPLWESKARDIISCIRFDILLSPPIANPNHAVPGPLDAGSPYWNPRPPSAEEDAEINKGKQQMSDLDKQHDGPNVFGNATDADLRKVMTGHVDDLLEELTASKRAVNSTD